MKVTRYFKPPASRPDRAMIADAWIIRVIQNPEYEAKQSDGRIRKWARIAEAGNRYLRVVLLENGETVHRHISAEAPTLVGKGKRFQGLIQA